MKYAFFVWSSKDFGILPVIDPSQYYIVFDTYKEAKLALCRELASRAYDYRASLKQAKKILKSDIK